MMRWTLARQTDCPLQAVNEHSKSQKRTASATALHAPGYVVSGLRKAWDSNPAMRPNAD